MVIPGILEYPPSNTNKRAQLGSHLQPSRRMPFFSRTVICTKSHSQNLHQYWGVKVSIFLTSFYLRYMRFCFFCFAQARPVVALLLSALSFSLCELLDRRRFAQSC